MRYDITAQNRTIPDWFTQIRLGHIVLPRFQRYEAWSHSTISQLFNTVLQGLPVGAMLVLKVGDYGTFLEKKADLIYEKLKQLCG